MRSNTALQASGCRTRYELGPIPASSLLGRVIEAATGTPLAQVLADEVLTPAGLTETVSEQTARIPEPIQHRFTAERSVYEDSAFWNPSRTLPEGACKPRPLMTWSAVLTPASAAKAPC